MSLPSVVFAAQHPGERNLQFQSMIAIFNVFILSGIDYTQNKCERDGSGRMRTYPVPSECTRWTSGTRITLVYFTSNRHVTASADARSFLQTKCPLPSPVSARCSYWFLRYFAACPEVCLKIPVSPVASHPLLSAFSARCSYLFYITLLLVPILS
jgi:hypothetical protein